MSEQSDDEYIGVGSKCLYEGGMSSLTAEQYGVISGVLALIILCRCYATNNVKPTVVFWIDNEETLSRTLDAHDKPIKLKDYDVSDYTMMMRMKKVIILAEEVITI